MSEGEQRLSGGWVNEVVRIGDTVHRSAGPWTPSIHALLRHLEAKGFDAAPRALGFDEQGREVLTYIEGEVSDEPWPPELLTDDGLAQLARLLRRYHDAVADFEPPRGLVWRHSQAPTGLGEIVCHGDPGPWNFVWRGGQAIGLIDWDFAEPGPALNDLAYLASNAVPLRDEDRPAKAGFRQRPDFRRRLAVACEAYGHIAPRDVLNTVFEVVNLQLERTLHLGALGIEPWVTFLRRTNGDGFRRELRWLRANQDSLL